MADNQDNQETSQASSLDQLTQAAGQLGQPHSNAVVPHKIANHDMLVQTSIWGGSDVGWINLNDTQDQLNARMDLHKVEKTVQAQVTAIGDTVKRANDAVDQANKAIDSSNVNKAAIDAANSAIAEAKQSASDAVQKLQSVESSVNTTSDEVTKVKQSQADQIKQVTNQLSDAVTQAKAATDSLDAKTTALQTAVKNAQSDATVATQTASQASVTAIDAKGDATTALATAKQVTVDMKNAESDVMQAKATASEATITAGNAASDALVAKATASSASLTATNASSDVAQVSAAADSLSTRMTAVEGKTAANSTAIDENAKAITLKADQTSVNDLSKSVSENSAELKVQANKINSKVSSTELKEVSDKADSAIAGNAKAESDAQVASSKADSAAAGATKAASDAKTASDKADTAIAGNSTATSVAQGASSKADTAIAGASAATSAAKEASSKADTAIAGNSAASSTANAASAKADKATSQANAAIAATVKNATAIDQNSKAIALKANQTTVDALKTTVTDNSAAVSVLNDEIKLKVDTTTVNNIVDSKGFATTNTVQSLVDQKAGQISQTITDLKTTVDGNGNAISAANDKISNLTQAIDGFQTTVKNKADQSQITQLANALQVKMSGSIIAQAADVTLTYTGNENEYPPVAPLVGMNDVDKGSTLILSFDYVASDDTKLTPQLDGTPWIPWGTNTNATDVKKGEKGTYRAEITVNDDSWQKGNAKNLCIRCDGFKGTIEITNLVLKYADTTLNDVQSSFDMLRDDINLRVTKDGLISQINLEAGGDGLISIQNGKGKLMLDADSVVFGNKAFIPSAAITNIQADQITSGTLDAGNIRVINLTADSIHGGTLDVGNMNVKNFSADDIKTGTLTGIKVKTGDKDHFFQTSRDNIYWVHDKSTSLIGTDTYLSPGGGMSIADQHNITISTWAGAQVNDDGTIVNSAGTYGWPKIIIDSEGQLNPDSPGGANWDGWGWGKAQIVQWIGDKEYLRLGKGQGARLSLNGDIAKSEFDIQKDNCIGAYFGQGDHGNQINLITTGNGQGVNVTGDFHVTGSKNSIINTKQGYLAINAYETAEYYFGDIGESNTGDAAQVVIGIDRIFNETVNTDIQYQVFVTPYSDAHVWVEKRYNNRFVVKSDKPNAEFGWELKAKRKGYESNRLRRVNVDVNPLQLKGVTK